MIATRDLLRLSVVAAAAVVGVLLAGGAALLPLGSGEASAQAAQRPNVVFVLADDMRYDDLSYMPKTRDLIGSQGMTFSEAYVPLGICCPSRASILTGMYAHNHDVWFNENGSNGGWQGFRAQGHQQDNVATRLRGAGYRTGLFGKYLNGYDGSVVPQGWDDWFGKYHGYYYNWDVNDNGTKHHYGRSEGDYSTDVIASQARSFVGASVAAGKPFFAYVSPVAPHEPSTPAARDLHEFDGERAPRLPSFDEANVSDKPSFIRDRPRLSASDVAAIDDLHENRVESLQAVDDLVEGLVNELSAQGVLGNTYVVFTSDNGWHQGEHRIPDRKHQVYEESIHMPLVIRGPGVAAGTTTDKLALNIDFYPTFARLGGATASSRVDGRSLLPVLKGAATGWRSAVLLEKRHRTHQEESFFGVLTSESKKYVEYRSGDRELYDLGEDPYELRNTYSGRPPADLGARLENLKGCAGASCRRAEGG